VAASRHHGITCLRESSGVAGRLTDVVIRGSRAEALADRFSAIVGERIV